jgi:hypothetical protein
MSAGFFFNVTVALPCSQVTRSREMVQLPQVVELNMIVSAGGIRTEKPLAKTVLAKLIQIGEPTRSIYAERLRELKPNARGSSATERQRDMAAPNADTGPLERK